jgi:phosphatidylinositol-4,5-bisphosphate 3-kinase catalytic subunit alpha/beta/delta
LVFFYCLIYKEETKNLTEAKFQKYITQFYRSTAGSIVASYILDLGDRHSGNILVQEEDALLFHIDFGHILGHKKSKFGVKREVEPFIYLEEMHQLINYDYCNNKEIAKKNFEDFQELCCEGFKIARENFILFHNLLNLLIPANITELDKESITKTIKNFHLELLGMI